MAVSRRYRPTKPRVGNFDQNDGVAGVVYILRNEAFKENWLKIGQSRHSGHVRARDMNKAASTGLPAHHVCVYECRTLDCGTAEKLVFQELRRHRKGRQEFFEVDIEVAKAVIARVCAELDASTLRNLEQARLAERAAAERREAEARSRNAEFLREAEERRQQESQQECRRRQIEIDRQEAEWRALREIRQQHAEDQRLAALPPVDMTCPSCSVVLTIPGSAATRSRQRLRCKNCLTVFLVDGTIVPTTVNDADSGDLSPQFAQTPGAPEPQAARNRFGWLYAPLAAVCLLGLVVEAGRMLNRPDTQVSPTAQARPAVPTTAAPPPKSQNQLLQEAADDIARKYPFLEGKAGMPITDRIVERRDLLIMSGTDPVTALRQAADEIAPRYGPPSR